MSRLLSPLSYRAEELRWYPLEEGLVGNPGAGVGNLDGHSYQTGGQLGQECFGLGAR